MPFNDPGHGAAMCSGPPLEQAVLTIAIYNQEVPSFPVSLSFRWRPRLSDPDDDMVLETAINGSASAIVTFNQSDFAAGMRGFDCAVIMPVNALQQIRS
jgi:predicted nucleic acid-binding protein